MCKRPGYLVDHIKPLCEGGTNEDSNKQLLCAPCHDVKSAREAAARAAGESVR
ncbi:HNH endonuclease [Massilia antarctica]